MKNQGVFLECQNILWEMVSKVGGHISKVKQCNCIIEFADVFSFSSKDLGRTREHHICTSDAQPVHLPPCRIPQACREELRALLKDMLECNVIQQTDSQPKTDREFPWNARISYGKWYLRLGVTLAKVKESNSNSLLLEFADVFSFSSKDLGRTKELKHHTGTSDAQPVHLPPRRIPQACREELRALLKDMLENDVIEPNPRQPSEHQKGFTASR